MREWEREWEWGARHQVQQLLLLLWMLQLSLIQQLLLVLILLQLLVPTQMLLQEQPEESEPQEARGQSRSWGAVPHEW